MSDFNQLEAQYLQKDRPDLEGYVKNALEDGKEIPMPVLDALARFFEGKRQYTHAESLPKLMSLLDGRDDDRGTTIRLQKALKMASTDGYVASPKKGTSSTYDAFWTYYDARKKEEECRANPEAAGCPNPEKDRRAKLDNPRDFSALLEYALEDDALSDEELDAVAKYLGSAETVWKETRIRVASLLDDVKDPNSADRVLGRKFQIAIGHSETDGIIGGKEKSNTIARFWQYYNERKAAGGSRPTPAPVSPAVAVAPAPAASPAPLADQTPEVDGELRSTADLLAGPLRKSAPLTAAMTQRILGYVFGGTLLKHGEDKKLDAACLSRLRDLVGETTKRSGKTESYVAGVIATEFGFDGVSTVDEEFLKSLNRTSRIVTNNGDRNGSVIRMSPASNRVRLRGADAESFREELKGRYVNPKLLRELFDKHVAALKSRSDDELRIDWENLAKVILTKDIPTLYREKESYKGSLGHQLDFMFMSVSGGANRGFERGARQITFFDLLLRQSQDDPSSTVDAATAQAGVAGFAEANREAYSHYSDSVVSQGGFRKIKTDALDLSTTTGQQAFLEQARKATREGWKYYGGMTETYRARFPRMRAEEAEARLEKKNALEIAQMIVDLSKPFAPGTKSESERLETRSFFLIVYDYVAHGIVSNLDSRFEEREGKADTDSILRDREAIVTRIRPVIANSIMTDADIVTKKKDRSYIGPILLPKPQDTRARSGSENFQEAQSFRRTHMLQQELDAPVLPVSVNGTVYVIESRGAQGWVVMPPMSAMLGDRGVLIPQLDKNGIASALAAADRMTRGAK